TIGRGTHSGAISLQTLSFASPLTVAGTGGITLAGDFDGAALTVGGDLLVDGVQTIDTVGGDFTVTGTTNGANAGGTDTLSVTATGATVDFQGTIGAGTDLEGLTVAAAALVELPN